MALEAVHRKLRRTICMDHRAAADGYLKWANLILGAAEKYLGRSNDLRILDLGCGESYSVTLLLSAMGCRCTGIDVEPAWQPSPLAALKHAARSGPRSVVKRLVHEYVVVRRVNRSVARLAKLKMPTRLDVRCMSITETPFSDNEFDMIFSLAVMEHIMDMDAALAEMNV